MSAWMFDSNNMNRLVAAIQFAAKNGHPTPASLFGANIGRKLFAMNAEALRQRYGDDDKEYRAYDKRYNYAAPSPMIDEVQMCKTLHCFLYQCSEGDVPNQLLFADVKAVAEWFNLRVGYGADASAWKSPETKARYNAAVWG